VRDDQLDWKDCNIDKWRFGWSVMFYMNDVYAGTSHKRKHW